MTTLSQRSPVESRLAALTTAHLLFGAILLGAAILRFVELGALPLGPAEAAEALAAYAVWEPARLSAANPVAIGSPLYFSLTALLKPLTGGDGALRLLPALFGLALVALPWRLRDRLGTLGALIAAALLAVAPTHVALARTAGGDSAALFGTLLLAIVWLRLADGADTPVAARRAIVGALALAIGLTSSALFYSGLVSLLAAGLLAGLRLPRLSAAAGRAAVLSGGVALLLLATLALTQPDGLAAAAALPANWLGGFGLGRTTLDLALGLLRYEAGALLIGVPALLACAARLRRAPDAATAAGDRLLLFWALTALLLALAQNGALTALPLLTLPLYLLVGRAADRLLTHGWNRYAALVLLLGVIWGGIALVNVGRYTRLDARDIFPLLVVVLILLAFSFLAVTVVPQPRAALQGIALSALLLWAFVAWGTATSLSRLTGNDPRELWVSAAASDDDVRLLRATLRESSFQLNRSIAGLPIVSSVDNPTLRWYLRDFADVTYVATLPTGSAVQSAAAVIVPAGSEPPPLVGNYVSTTFDVISRRDPAAPAPTLTERLQWWFFRDSAQPLAVEQVQLWLRVDG